MVSMYIFWFASHCLTVAINQYSHAGMDVALNEMLTNGAFYRCLVALNKILTNGAFYRRLGMLLRDAGDLPQ